MSAFRTKLENGWTAQQSLLTLGLDPDPARFPAPLQQVADPLYAFCRAMVDACAPYVCAFKPQIAYFSSAHGEAQLEALCHHIKAHYPDHTLILDAKRGDIGATAAHYAKEAFERYQADAVTVNPYMGLDSIEPFLQWSEKGVFILCRTSNPGGSDLQFLTLENGQPLYLYLAELIARHWDKQQQCGLVVGATFPDEIRAVRAVVGDMPLLIPGIGAQGGDIARTVAAGADQRQQGMLINSSRAILYASQGEDWLQAAQQVAQSTRDAINAALVTRP